MTHSSLTVGSFIAAVLVLIPLPSHWRARNVATLSLIAWLFVVDIIYGVNTTVWSGNAEVRLVVWCDIATKVIVGASSALPACTLCICKHLELVASGRVVRLSDLDKRRRMIFELAMCFGLPMVLMALHYIVQGHRFDIIEDIGCQPETYYSIPAIFIVCLPPLALSAITLVYAALALYHFFRQRIMFASHLQKSNSSLTTSRYLRLVAMSITEMLWGSSLASLAMYDNVSPGLLPYTSWQLVHVNFSRIGQYALVEFPPQYLTQLFLYEWAVPASSFIFFIFFGFGEESIKDFYRVVGWFRHRVLRQKPKEEPKASFGFSRPPRVVVSTFSIVETCGDSKDDQTLPCYSPPADEKMLPAMSSKTDVETISNDTWSDKDVAMQDLPSPSVASTRATAAQSLHRISISDMYPPSQPPSPRPTQSVPHPESVYPRNLSPPRIPPIAPNNPFLFETSVYGKPGLEADDMV